MYGKVRGQLRRWTLFCFSLSLARSLARLTLSEIPLRETVHEARTDFQGSGQQVLDPGAAERWQTSPSHTRTIDCKRTLHIFRLDKNYTPVQVRQRTPCPMMVPSTWSVRTARDDRSQGLLDLRLHARGNMRGVDGSLIPSVLKRWVRGRLSMTCLYCTSHRLPVAVHTLLCDCRSSPKGYDMKLVHLCTVVHA